MANFFDTIPAAPQQQPPQQPQPPSASGATIPGAVGANYFDSVPSEKTAGAPPDISNPAAEFNPVQLAGIAFDNALAGNWRGVKQAAALGFTKIALTPENEKYWQDVYDQAQQAEGEARKQFAPVLETRAGKVGDFAGNVAPWLAAGPMGAATATGRMATALLFGGAQGFMRPLGTGETWVDRLKNTAVGAAGSVFGQGLGESMGAARRAVVGNVLQKSAPALPPDVAARTQAYQDLGINPARPQVTRDPADWAQWQELGKRQGPPQDAFTTQQQETNQTLGGVLPSMQVSPAQTNYSRAEAARQAVQAWNIDARNVASGTYQAARTAPGADAAFPAAPFFAQADAIVKNFGSQLPPEVVTRMKQLQAGWRMNQGMETPGVDIADVRPFTVGEASDLYQLINDATTPGTKGAALGSQLKTALANAGSQMPGDAGTAMKLFQDATQQWRNLKVATSPAPIKTLANPNLQEAKPEFLTNVVTSGKPKEIGALIDMVTQSHSEAAPVVHDALLQYLQDQAVSTNGTFSGLKLGQAMDKVGSDRLGAVLSPQEMARLSSLRLAAEGATVTPNATGMNFSNTAATIGNMTREGHGAPLAGGLIGSMIEHHLESVIPIPGAGAALGAGLGWLAQRRANAKAGSQMDSILHPDMSNLAFQLAGETPGLRQPFATLGDMAQSAIRAAGAGVGPYLYSAYRGTQ